MTNKSSVDGADMIVYYAYIAAGGSGRVTNRNRHARFINVGNERGNITATKAASLEVRSTIRLKLGNGPSENKVLEERSPELWLGQGDLVATVNQVAPLRVALGNGETMKRGALLLLDGVVSGRRNVDPKHAERRRVHPPDRFFWRSRHWLAIGLRQKPPDRVAGDVMLLTVENSVAPA